MRPDLILNDDIFCNDHDALRLYKIRDYFGNRKEIMGSYINKQGEEKNVVAYCQTSPLTKQDLDQLVDLYTSWRDLDEVVPIKYVYQDKEIKVFDTPKDAEKFAMFTWDHFSVVLDQYKNVLTIPFEVCEWGFPHACKRGNPVYIDLVKKRFKPFLEQDVITFFDPAYVGCRKRKSKTNMLYITGTTDPSTCGFDRGWLSFGKRWNSFITNLRKQFGSIVYIRTWQSQKNGYPHFHALLYFKDIEFTVVSWDHGDGKISYRLPSRSKQRSAIKKAWQWGNLDIICVDNTQGAFTDLLKYVTRDLEGGESDLTNTMVWYFGKQAFAISRDFTKVVWGVDQCIGLAEPNDADLISANMCNSNLELIRIEIYPTIRADLVYSDPPKTYQTNFFGKDPPPKPTANTGFLERLTVEYDLVKCRSSKKFECPVFMYVHR